MRATSVQQIGRGGGGVRVAIRLCPIKRVFLTHDGERHCATGHQIGRVIHRLPEAAQVITGGRTGAGGSEIIVLGPHTTALPWMQRINIGVTRHLG